MLSSFYKRVFSSYLAIFILMGTAFFNQAKAETMHEVQLKNGENKVTFSLPSEYRANANSESLMILHCRYPGMEARNADKGPQPDSITIYVEVSEKKAATNSLVANAAESYDPRYPGKDVLVGTKGAFKIYRAFLGQDANSPIVETFVFKAADGALVGVDNVEKLTAFTANRKLGPNLHIKYLIAKPIGTDFIQIDKLVTNFVRTHIKEQRE
jgi:hypothetical protein